MAEQPRRFHLQRNVDVTGASGTGLVADGVLWPDGSASVRWRGDRPSIVWWATLDDVEHIHGHGGHTRIIWDDPRNQTPTANWVDAWHDLAAWVDSAAAEGRPVTVADVQERMAELKELALSPVHDWLKAPPVMPIVPSDPGSST